jgi:hypothetical protein
MSWNRSVNRTKNYTKLIYKINLWQEVVDPVQFLIRPWGYYNCPISTVGLSAKRTPQNWNRIFWGWYFHFALYGCPVYRSTMASLPWLTDLHLTVYIYSYLHTNMHIILKLLDKKKMCTQIKKRGEYQVQKQISCLKNRHKQNHWSK